LIPNLDFATSGEINVFLFFHCCKNCAQFVFLLFSFRFGDEDIFTYHQAGRTSILEFDLGSSGALSTSSANITFVEGPSVDLSIDDRQTQYWCTFFNQSEHDFHK
jgi:hypothetical protein